MTLSKLDSGMLRYNQNNRMYLLFRNSEFRKEQWTNYGTIFFLNLSDVWKECSFFQQDGAIVHTFHN